MTTSTLTYLAAREHINDLQREAHLHRLAAELRAPRRVWLRVPRLLARRVARAATATQVISNRFSRALLTAQRLD